MKLQIEFNTDYPDDEGNIFSETVIDGIANSAKDVPVFLGEDSKPFGIITDAQKTDKTIELGAKLDETRPETEFFEKGHIMYSISCTYKNMDFEQTGDVRLIKSAQLASITIEPGRKKPPASLIFTIN